MRIITLTFLTVLVSLSIFAQPWIENLPQGKPKKDLTLFDYQQAFESYWAPYKVDKGSYFENGIKKKAPGWKQFKRWEYEMQSLVNPRTGEFPLKSAMEVRKAFEQANPRSITSVSASWSPLGPTSSFSGYSGIGRLNCVAFHPTDLNTYWVGAAAGGLWMTTDNGSTWTCETDNNGVLAVSDIVIPTDYETSNTIYIATGDRDGWDNRSIGVLKSTDRGETWIATGLSFTIYEGQMANRLLMDPFNNQILYAATTRGVFKTFDGGTTWDSLLTSIEFIDLEFNPLNPTIIYGSTKNGKIYLSTDGNTFNDPVYSDDNARRIELAVSPNQPGWVYAVASNSDNGLYTVLQSTDHGNSFIEVFSGSTKNLLTWSSDGSGDGGQGWYDLCLAASPFDANVLLIGGVNTWRSTDGGVNWSIVNHWYGDQVQAVHADKHKLAFRDNGDLFECNDGGVYLSQDNGTTWSDKTNGIQISQMYRLGVSQSNSEDVITGLQDNGTKLYSVNNWFDVRGGDGMECLIDYSDVNIQYGSLYFGQFDRTDNHWQSSTNVTPPDEGAWVTPFIINPIHPASLYGGYNEVWKSTDRGENWTQISFIDIPGQIQSMAIAPSDTNYLYIANWNEIWKTINGGIEWMEITANLPTENAGIEYITVKDDDPNTIWVALGGFANPGVYQSEDGGISWTSISSGLPPIPAHAVVQNQQNPDGVHLYLGTDLGVYFKNGDADWVPYNTGLPNVRIGEIEIYYSENPGESRLRAATYGRGLWESPIEYASSPMIFVSSKASQPNTSAVEPDQLNQEILKVEIQTNGNLDPLYVSSFTFSTLGSTDPAHDITNARLFFTGSSSAFTTGNQYGNVVDSPNGEFVITGSQELINGKNYFWLTYDLPGDATHGNRLDAQCLTLTADEPRVITVSDPDGYRIIGYEFCEAGAAQMTYEYISRVRMGTIDQPSGKGDKGFEDYTSLVMDVVKGAETTVEVQNGVPYFADEVIAWVDWNFDGDFDDADEFLFNTGPSGDSLFYGSFITPVGAHEGKVRMRIRLHDSENGPNEMPCGFATWGEVEDYTLNVHPTSAPVAGIAGSDLVLCAGWFGQILLQEYDGNIQWQESPDGISEWTNVSGGSGANTDVYTTPPLEITTFYRAEVTQPTYPPIYSNNVWLLVMPAPGDAGLLTGDTSICQNNEIVIYAVPDIENAEYYLWTLPEGATGESDSNSIHVTFNTPGVSGNISVAGVLSGCSGASSTLPVSVYAIPAAPVITYNESEQNLHSSAPLGNQWYDQQGPIDGATAQDYHVTKNGNYYVIVTENGCTSDLSNIIQVLTSSVEIGGNVYRINTNPNPVNDQMVIEIRGNSKLLPFEILDGQGHVLIKGEVSDRHVVQTDVLLPGLYFLQVKTNSRFETIKFVKE